MSSVEERLRQLVAKVLGVDPGKHASLSMSTVPEWDSMNHLLLITEIEKEFCFKFTTQEVIDVNGLDDILAVMKKKDIIN